MYKMLFIFLFVKIVENNVHFSSYFTIMLSFVFFCHMKSPKVFNCNVTKCEQVKVDMNAFKRLGKT